jgi:hypothetical protein
MKMGRNLNLRTVFSEPSISVYGQFGSKPSVSNYGRFGHTPGYEIREARIYSIVRFFFTLILFYFIQFILLLLFRINII